MEIFLSENCGLCAGCTFAINQALKTAKEYKNVVLLKEIVHNKNVNKMLEKEGIKIIESLENLPINSTVILRAHGEPIKTYSYLEDKNINYVDCTCFNVKKIHEKVQEFSDKNYKIIIIGKHENNKNIHPEVLGTMGWCKEVPILIKNEQDLQNFNPEKNQKYYLVCQTTFNIEKAENLIKKIQKLCKQINCELVVNKSLCLAQKLINEKSVELAQKVDLMIVIGGKNSSNTKELFENLKTHTKSIFLENVLDVFEELKNNKIDITPNLKIGLTAGASTPKEDIIELHNLLKNI